MQDQQRTAVATVEGVGGRAARLSDLPFRGIGGQPAFEPDELEKFVARARIAVLSYVRKDGRPGQAPIWYVYRDGVFHMSTDAGSAKEHALRRDPRVCVTIQDERAPYRAVIFDAIAEVAEQGRSEGTDGIAQRYFGRIGGAKYQQLRDDEGAPPSTGIILRPVDVRGFDNTRMLARPLVWFLRARPHLPFLRRFL